MYSRVAGRVLASCRHVLASGRHVLASENACTCVSCARECYLTCDPYCRPYDRARWREEKRAFSRRASTGIAMFVNTLRLAEVLERD